MEDNRDKELNKQLKEWQDTYSKMILSNKWDCYIAEELTDLEISMIQAITTAKKYGDVNTIIWNNTDWLIDKIKGMMVKPTCHSNIRRDHCVGKYRRDGLLYARCMKCKWRTE